MRKAGVAVITSALLATACGGNPAHDVLPDRAMKAAHGITIPEPPPARPGFVLTFPEPYSGAKAARVASIRGVALAVPMSLSLQPVSGAGGATALRVGALDPLLFRALAPEATREAEFVWSALVAGEAVPTFDAADRLGIEGSGDIVLAGIETRAGAIADNAVPNIADVLVAEFDAKRLGLERPRAVVVGLRAKADSRAVAKTLRKRWPGARLRALLPEAPGPTEPEAPEVVGETSGGLIGTMTFQVTEDGFIRPNAEWVSANIASTEVPILGSVTCHRLLLPQLHAALSDVATEGLSESIYQYGGCYVPRFIDRDPSKPLSMHAFGLAIDVNTPSNQLGTRGDMDPAVVEIFERWGFVWGGRWSRPDPMHFELGRLIRP